MSPEEFFVKYTGSKQQSGSFSFEFMMDFAACYADFEYAPTEVEVVNEVISDLAERSEAGREKYGTTMDREDLTTKEWLQHAYEETLDLALYLKKLLS